jgi:hypothetical protein
VSPAAAKVSTTNKATTTTFWEIFVLILIARYSNRNLHIRKLYHFNGL